MNIPISYYSYLYIKFYFFLKSPLIRMNCFRFHIFRLLLCKLASLMLETFPEIISLGIQLNFRKINEYNLLLFRIPILVERKINFSQKMFTKKPDK